ncbi:MAG: hypothetical protein KO463_04785 [Candidatus Methanofastidiosa archaeon]|nr:hypothetical protein [Candidatus Methanofastidiosa archaeon]
MNERTIDVKNLDYRELNRTIREAVAGGVRSITLNNVLGQRFIADGITAKDLSITVNGVPGGDLGAFMDGPSIRVNGNADHAPGNTMTSGTIIIDGDAGDCVGHSMRGGTIMVRGNVGYRVGIHMKQYREQYPKIVIGGYARSFLGEYMAGGIILILGLDATEAIVQDYVGTGIHGGTIYIAGELEDHQLGVAAVRKDFTEDDLQVVTGLITQFNAQFGTDVDPAAITFTKIQPMSARPFSGLYTTER